MYYLLRNGDLLNSNNIVVINYLAMQKSGDEDYQAPIEEFLVDHYGLIKQGETVFELIEQGDLVKLKNTSNIHLITKSYDDKLCICNWPSLELTKLIKDNMIVAIYKKIDEVTYKLIWEVNNGKEN